MPLSLIRLTCHKLWYNAIGSIRAEWYCFEQCRRMDSIDHEMQMWVADKTSFTGITK